MRASAFAAIYGVCGILFLVVYSVYQWLDPNTPLILGVVGVALPILVVVALLDDEVRPPNVNVLRAAEGVLVAGIFGVAAPMMWTLDHVRVRALAHFPSKLAIERALDDRSEPVRETACRMMFDDRFEYELENAVAALSSRPQLAVRCLDALPSDEDTSFVTRRLAIIWHKTLLSGDAADCEKASALDRLAIKPANRASMLLDCTLQANLPQARQCCAEHLQTAYPDRKLLVQTKLSGDEFEKMGTLAPLVAASFGEKALRRKLRGLPKRLGLDSDEYRRFSAVRACRVVARGESMGAEARHMEWVFESHSQCLPPEMTEEPVDVAASCEEFLRVELDDTDDLASRLCEARAVSTRRLRAEAASVRMGQNLGAMAEEIEQGRLTEQSGRLALDNFGELVGSGEIHELNEDERRRLWGSPSVDGDGVDMQDAVSKAHEVAKKGGKTPATQQRLIEDGVETMMRDQEESGMPDVPIEEIEAAMGPDGEVSDEMKERLREAARRKK